MDNCSGLLLKHEAFFVLVFLLFTTSQVAYGQTKKLASPTTVLLVDTDDSCRLTVDDQDEGVITPDQSRKINIGLGDHIVKCVIEKAPDLMWRKAVEAKNSEQVVAIVALKALHIQYDQAVGNVQQQKEKAAAAKEQVAAAEEKRQARQNELSEARNNLVGTWQNVSTSSVPYETNCPEKTAYVTTTTFNINVGSESASDVLAVQKTWRMTSHHISPKTCKVDKDESFSDTSQGFVKLTLDSPFPIEIICDGCSDAQRAERRSDYNALGEIAFITANKISIDWKQHMTGKMELDRVR